MESDIQIENGNYTRIHNDILDILAKTRLASLEFALVIFIFRKTYGYQKKNDVISIAQFCDATGASKTGVIEALNNLIRLNILYREPVGQMYSYGFNKYYDQWLPEVYVSRRAGQTKNFGDRCKSIKKKSGQPTENNLSSCGEPVKLRRTGQPMENTTCQPMENQTCQVVEYTQKKERKLNKLKDCEIEKNPISLSEPQEEVVVIESPEIDQNINSDFLEKNPKTKKQKIPKEPKPKLKPDDPNFWKFLKENAQYGQKFYEATKLFPVGKQFGLWIEACQEFREAGVTPEIIPKAVSLARTRKWPIKSPKSILTAAREIKMNQETVSSELDGWLLR